MKRDLTRKEFLGLSLGLVAFAAGCGDDGGTGDDAAGSSSGAGSSGDGGPSTNTSPGDSSGGPGDSSGGPGDSSGGPGDSSSGGPGDSSSGGPGDSTGDTGAGACVTVTAVFDNHPHDLQIPIADIEAGVEMTYTAGGSHDHDVTLTAGDFANLAAGQTIMVDAELGGGMPHPHVVTINCEM
jgi:hypothetical protein